MSETYLIESISQASTSAHAIVLGTTTTLLTSSLNSTRTSLLWTISKISISKYNKYLNHLSGWQMAHRRMNFSCGIVVLQPNNKQLARRINKYFIILYYRVNSGHHLNYCVSVMHLSASKAFGLYINHMLSLIITKRPHFYYHCLTEQNIMSLFSRFF